jgi:hypothetical protein
MTFAFKTGVKKFYTSLSVSYNPFKQGIREQLFFGFGLGTIIDINNKFFINPELMYANGIDEDFQQFLSLIPYLGYNITSNIGVLLGPSVLWNYGRGERMPFIDKLKYKLNDKHSLFFGGRIALRLQW